MREQKHAALRSAVREPSGIYARGRVRVRERARELAADSHFTIFLP